MQQQPQATARVEGHTDSVGDSAVNEQLSRDRAEAVRSMLMRRGVSGDRITSAAGFGASRAVQSNDTHEGRAQNRRADVFISEPQS
jgi:outer membrane protein OmpA-like peptidoglycan-associated protein